MTPEQNKSLEATMSKLGQAHDLLAKTKLSTKDYQPISTLLAEAKVALFKLYNEMKKDAPAMEERAKEYADNLFSKISIDKNTHPEYFYLFEVTKEAIAGAFIAGSQSTQHSEGDAVEFVKWLGANYDFNEFTNQWGKFWEIDEANEEFTEMPIKDLYQLFIKSKQNG